MILLRQYFLVKTQISWPNSEVDAALACGPLVVAQLAEVGEDGEQLGQGCPHTNTSHQQNQPGIKTTKTQ